jgi:hypothetical protein
MWATTKKQDNTVKGDPEQDYYGNWVYLTSAREIEDAFSQWEGSGNYECCELRGGQEALES